MKYWCVDFHCLLDFGGYSKQRRMILNIILFVITLFFKSQNNIHYLFMLNYSEWFEALRSSIQKRYSHVNGVNDTFFGTTLVYQSQR